MTDQRRSGSNIGTMVLLGVIGLLVFFLMQRGCWVLNPSWSMSWGNHVMSFGPFTRFYGLLGIWGLIQIALAIWVGVDANRRGLNGFLWGLLVLITNIVGLIIYLIAAPLIVQKNGGVPALAASPAPAAAPAAVQRRCPGCQAAVESDFKVCPFCGVSLRCSQCEKPIQAGWKVCPNCGTPTGSSTP